jgi:hypothetical protein
LILCRDLFETADPVRDLFLDFSGWISAELGSKVYDVVDMIAGCVFFFSSAEGDGGYINHRII